MKRHSLVMFIIVLLAALVVIPALAQTAELPPLTELGPYGVGIKVLDLVDERRGDWHLETYVWFPADPTKGKQLDPKSPARMGAVPAKDGAPYPLIIYSHSWMDGSSELTPIMENLASRGYVVAATTHHDTSPQKYELVDRPLDIQMMLDGLAAVSDGPLAGLIDSSKVGLMGYSQGADAVLQMLGLLRDPGYLAGWCADHPDLKSWDCTVPPYTDGMYVFAPWSFKDIAAYRAQLGLADLPDGSWAPFGDARIRAVLAIAPCDFPLTTEDMLAAVTTPTMIVQGTEDMYCDYEGNAVRTYTHLGTDDRYLISAAGVASTIVTWRTIPQHFAAAFFGKYLKGDDTYAPYLTPEGLAGWDSPKLVWGPYEGE